MSKGVYPFKRYPKNPILIGEDVPYPCNTVLDGSACKFKDHYILLLRVENLKGNSDLTLASSEDGYHFSIEPQPWISPSTDPH